ncbi:bifunctional [glutamate--ammonia ligase]-adenylyl-L-tyrosine phosphorylase/[glutamate--ammonia-ligase] adenylyltransferase [Marinimicrobium sp. C2-29]|uniref:bifunctional [glutamate--ammonia ligase]-adenylyl-L-tyrosine phosphorylase/[glutamate--ammonia-ligase] adenylyltransferase n=1 Tax=Marinimicrobium sp. C2-29 TaxID=3139825 RepID=UPI003139D7A0
MFDEKQVPAPLQEAARKRFDAFAESLKSSELSGPESQLPDDVTPEDFAEQINRAFAASDYIAKTCTQRPELLLELVESGELFRPLEDLEYSGLKEALAGCESDSDLDLELRRQRQRAMVRIIWRDLNRLADMRTITNELSRFAEAAIQYTLDWHFEQMKPRWGVPMGSESGTEQPMIVLGMGKLGARELNVSSDIDLIFAFPETGQTEGGKRSLDNQEFFTRLGQRLIKSLDAPSAEGFVFRVDMRLRPYGDSGALVSSYDAMEEYYQSQGRDWERYAMIKARPVAASGVGADAAADELMVLLRPFTYRQYIDFSVIDSLRSMKGLISRQVQRRGMSQDVKLGEGGIREIEFVVQVFQLIRGGRDPRLRERQVCELLPLLEQEDFLPEGSGETLLRAYEFLRNTEHAIQGYQDRQTQALPSDDEGRRRIAWVLGYDDWEAFEAELNAHRERVSAEFKAVIADPDADQGATDEELEAWVALWEGSLEGDEAGKWLAQQGFKQDADRVLSLVKSVRENRQVMSMQASSRDRLDAFMPRLLAMLAENEADGEALARIEPLVESVARRSAYLVLMVENPVAMQQLVRLCAASPWIADELARFPALLDELLTPESLYAPPDIDELRDELRRDVLRLPWDDLEGHMDTLRYFRSAHALRVAASEVTGALPLMKVSDYLTHIAEVILEHVLQLAWEQLVLRHGRPTGADGEPEQAPNFIIVGYGKLGGIELSHGSDLDLVFVYDADPEGRTDGEKPLDNTLFYTRLGQRIIHILNSRMPSGKLYEVDMRLRPNGEAGMLANSLAAFEKYQLNDAWTWEHQALVRARVVAGHDQLARDFNRVRREVLCQHRDAEPLREEVLKMREKMREHLGSQSKSSEKGEVFNLKQDAGGIVDIEFMVQYAVLAWAEQEPALTEYTDNIRILGALEQSGRLSAESVAQLIEVYKTYRSTGHRLALQRQEAVLEGEELFVDERNRVTGLWRQLIESPQ